MLLDISITKKPNKINTKSDTSRFRTQSEGSRLLGESANPSDPIEELALHPAETIGLPHNKMTAQTECGS
jgi:hypothetical protein